MKDTRPWVQETDSDEIRALLRSAELDEPPNGAMRRVLTKAGVGVGVGLAVVATSTTTASAAKLGPAVVGKWLAITAFVGAGAVAAVHVARPLTTKLAQPALTSTAHEAAPPAAPKPTPALEQTDTVVPTEPSNVEAPAAVPAPRAAKPSPAASADISGEIAAISVARAALDKGNARGALAALDHYQQDFPRGTLAPEATVLRIEALNVAGDRARAKSLGEAFLKAHPKSPHAQRVRSLIGAQ
jgi:TolA-binding protein